MARGQGGKKGLIVTIVVLGLTLLAVGTVVALQNVNRQPATDTSSEATPEKEQDPEETKTPETKPAETVTPAVDPSTLTSIDIEPLMITVFYTKGTGGFEFAVKRTADRTEYVEFSAPELVGSKCTGDTGAFASIIKSPASPEDKTTISETVVVDGVTYGLSLTGKSCTSDLTLLEKYQTGFKNGFSSLKAIP